MLVLLEATFEQLGAERSRVLGETTAEQLQAVETTLHCTHTASTLLTHCKYTAHAPHLQAVDTILGVAVDTILGASPEEPDATTVAVLDQHLHNQEHLPPLLGTDLAAQLRARGFAGLIVLHTGASAHDVRPLEPQARAPACMHMRTHAHAHARALHMCMHMCMSMHMSHARVTCTCHVHVHVHVMCMYVHVHTYRCACLRRAPASTQSSPRASASRCLCNCNSCSTATSAPRRSRKPQ